MDTFTGHFKLHNHKYTRQTKTSGKDNTFQRHNMTSINATIWPKYFFPPLHITTQTNCKRKITDRQSNSKHCCNNLQSDRMLDHKYQAQLNQCLPTLRHQLDVFDNSCLVVPSVKMTMHILRVNEMWGGCACNRATSICEIILHADLQHIHNSAATLWTATIDTVCSSKTPYNSSA